MLKSQYRATRMRTLTSVLVLIIGATLANCGAMPTEKTAVSAGQLPLGDWWPQSADDNH